MFNFRLHSLVPPVIWASRGKPQLSAFHESALLHHLHLSPNPTKLINSLKPFQSLQLMSSSFRFTRHFVWGKIHTVFFLAHIFHPSRQCALDGPDWDLLTYLPIYGMRSWMLRQALTVIFIFFNFVLLMCFFFFFLICSEFCHTLKWNSLGFTCLPHRHLLLNRIKCDSLYLEMIF